MTGDQLTKPDTSKVYYASAQEVEAAKARAAKRSLMKAEFQKQYTNPMKGVNNGGYIFDPAMQRFMTMKVSIYNNYRFNGKNLWKFLFTTVIPIVALAKYIHYEQRRGEEVFRSGSIPYSDRLWKY